MANRPIIQIPVDDAAFQRLFERMGEYQEMLGGLGDKWKEQDGAVSEVAATMVLVTAALEAQREMLAEQTAQMKEHADAQKEKARAQREEEKVERDAEKRRKQAVEDTKKIARSIKDATLDLAKWTFMGGAAGLIGGAASLWGLDKAANWVGDQRRAAMGYGVSIAERQSLNARFSRDFDVDSALEGMANAQMDPSKAAIFAALGLNPNGQDPATLALQGSLAVRRLLQNVPQRSQLAYAHALGIDQIYNPNSIRRIMGEKPGDLERRVGQYRQDLPGLKLASEAAEKWQDLVSELTIKTLQVIDPLVTKLSSPEIIGNLEIMIGKFSELAIQVLDRIDFKALGQGLDTFTTYISSKQFQQDFKTFIDDVAYAANKLAGVMHFLGLLPDAPGGITPAQQNVKDDQWKWDFWSRSNNALYGPILGPMITKGEFGDRPSSGGFAGPGTGGAYSPDGRPLDIDGAVAGGTPGRNSGVYDATTGADSRAMAYFMSQGWTKNAAAGMVAQLDAESGNQRNPSGSNDNGEAFGAGQWHADRQRRYNAWAAKRGLPDIRHSTLEQQWAFMSWEMQQFYGAVGKRLQGAKSAKEAGQIAVAYEGPRDAATARRDRGMRAQKLSVDVKVQAAGPSTAQVVNQLSPAS